MSTTKTTASVTVCIPSAHSIVLLTASKNFIFGMHFKVYEPICFKVGIVIDTVELCRNSRSQGCKEANTSPPIISQSVKSI